MRENVVTTEDEIIKNLTELVLAHSILEIASERERNNLPQVVSRTDTIDLAHNKRPKLAGSSLREAFDTFISKLETRGIAIRLRDKTEPTRWWEIYLKNPKMLEDAVRVFSYT